MTICEQETNGFKERILSARKARRGLGKCIKDTISNFQERSAIITEVWRIKRAVGHSANRVILDKQDKVILDVGELITYQVIEKARQANVLNILLSSVSRSDMLKKHHSTNNLYNSQYQSPVVL